MTALQAPQAPLVCQVLKGTKGSQESQGEKAQKGKRCGEKEGARGPVGNQGRAASGRSLTEDSGYELQTLILAFVPLQGDAGPRGLPGPPGIAGPQVSDSS